MYGIPNMKLDKGVVQRRIDLLAEEGIRFLTRTHIGCREEFAADHMTGIMLADGGPMQFVDPAILMAEYDAVLVATGATRPFDPTARCPGRAARGIHFAMDFLTRNTKSLLDSGLRNGQYISARDKHVIVIGGGDTGADCIGTSLRHGCRSVVNFELLERPPAERAANNPWPQWPRVYRVDYSHAETAARLGEDPRHYGLLTKEFLADSEGRVTGIKTVRVDWQRPDGKALLGSRRLGAALACGSRFACHRFPGPGSVAGAPTGTGNATTAGQLGDDRGRTWRVSHQCAGCFCRRRLSPRSVPRRVGDP